MVALVFVRSMADLHSSIGSANALLLFRRSRGGRAQDEEMAGVWVSSDLGAGLPGRYQSDEGTRRAPTDARLSKTDAESGLAMFESCELAGVWACGADEPLTSIAKEVHPPRTRYPDTVGSGWFHLDPTRGLVAGAPVSDGVP